MRRRMMKSKIHRATVSDADLHYVGSITLDTELMRLADIREMEQVHVLDIDNVTIAPETSSVDFGVTMSAVDQEIP